MAEAPVRSHFSIGEALEQLKAEFPDITISKIRFFEGQGLIEPERTPSGYRKFANADIARLRWVLHQQQDAYVPLKVLRDRLAEAENAGIVPPSVPSGASASSHDADADADTRSGSGRAHDDSNDVDIESFDGEDFDEFGESTNARVTTGAAGNAVMRGTRRQTAGGGGEPDLEQPEGSAVPDMSAESIGEFRHPAARARSATLRPAERSAVRATTRQEERESVPATAAPGPTAQAGKPASSDAALGSRNPMLGPEGGAPMAFHELAAASGLSLDDLRQLEELGFVQGRQLFDGRFYDHDALTVARTVVAFRAFGVEPRHLKMYRTAADREAAFFAQVVSPMLHRRGDDARTRTEATLAELRRLGDQLRDAALGHAVRAVLEGR